MGWVEKGSCVSASRFHVAAGHLASARGLGFRACLALVILVWVASRPSVVIYRRSSSIPSCQVSWFAMLVVVCVASEDPSFGSLCSLHTTIDFQAKDCVYCRSNLLINGLHVINSQCLLACCPTLNCPWLCRMTGDVQMRCSSKGLDSVNEYITIAISRLTLLQ